MRAARRRLQVGGVGPVFGEVGDGLRQVCFADFPCALQVCDRSRYLEDALAGA